MNPQLAAGIAQAKARPFAFRIPAGTPVEEVERFIWERLAKEQGALATANHSEHAAFLPLPAQYPNLTQGFPPCKGAIIQNALAHRPMETLTQPPVTLFSEATPNPETMKFVTNRFLVEGASHDFPSATAAEVSPLATALFNFPFVRGVFMANNFITVTKDAAETWDELTPLIKDFLKNYLEGGLPIVNVGADANAHAEEDSETIRQIKDILRDYVQPAVEQDGGAISFKSYEQGTVTVTLKGACSGCPSSTLTLKAGIEGLLKRMVPEVQEVVADSF